ncbi:MAG: winged helix-turn-helix domain-containing protein [Ekhidna sp.]
MKKLVIIGGIVAVFLFGILGYWFSKAFDANASQFDHSVSVALFTAADTMSERATVEKRSSNLFYVTTNSPVSNEEIDTLIQKEFLARNLALDYELGIYNADDDSLVYGNYVKSTEMNTVSNDTCDISDAINKNFAVLFPSRKSYLFGQMDAWFFAVVFLIFISWIYFYSISLYQKSTIAIPAKNTRIQLGNSCLDFHNQSLVVDNSTFRLTYKENQILKLLFENPNQVIDREVFLETIWKKDGFFVARSMDVFISKVRKYLRADQTIRIENLRSIGYRLHVGR